MILTRAWWINYYGHYHRTALNPVMRHFNKTLTAWAMKKYGKLNRHKTRAAQFIEAIGKEMPQLFEHWKQGMV